MLAHVAALPVQSAFVRQRNGVAALWSQEAELLATLTDETRVHTYLWARWMGAPAQAPAPLPRPWDAPEPTENATVDDVARLLME